MDLLLTNIMGVFVLAVIVGVIFKYLGLPSIIGQVMVGLGVGMSGIINHQTLEVMHFLGSLGITLLLFLVGLEMNWKDITKVGKSVFYLFLGQTLLLSAIFFSVFRWGILMDNLNALMIAIALTFSSTIVVVKSLSEGKDLGSYVGKLSLGILLLQDILAIFLLVLLPSLGDKVSFVALGIVLLKLLGVFLIVSVLGQYLISLLMEKVIKSGEDLILLSLAWFMVVSFIVIKGFGLSSEVAAFLAGLSLSASYGSHQIVNKVKTLRDIFLTLFFVLLGLQMGDGVVDWGLVTFLTGLVIGGKFLVTFVWARILKIHSRVAFLVSLNLTQISEFSLVVMSLGLSMGWWQNEMVRVVTLAGLISMSLSSVLIGMGAKIYMAMAVIWPWMREDQKVESAKVEMKNHLVLIGCDRTGRGIVSFLEKHKENFLVIDFNPDVIKRLKNKGVKAIFADASDPDTVELANIAEAKLIISTIKDQKESLALLNLLSVLGLKIPVVVESESAEEAKELYEAGATYVLFPHFVTGHHLSQLLLKHKRDKKSFEKYKAKQDHALRAIYEG